MLSSEIATRRAVVSSTRLTLLIDPPSRHFENDRLFDAATGTGVGENILAPFIHLRERLREQGIAVRTADALARDEELVGPLVYVSTGMRNRYRDLARREDVCMSAFFAFECPIVEPGMYADLHNVGTAFRRVLSYSSAEALRPFLRGSVRLRPFRLPQACDGVVDRIWSGGDRRFLAMINANKAPRLRESELYSERLRAVEFFEGHGEIDLYGMGWDGPTLHVGPSRVPARIRSARYQVARSLDERFGWGSSGLVAARRAYRGSVASKLQTLGRYTFAVCFENMMLEGWVTEKIFDCLVAGTIPVYLGAPDIEKWVPAECFIDARCFESYDELRDHLRSRTPREIAELREAGRAYLSSARFRPFSKDTFVELVGAIIAEDAGLTS